MIRLLSILVFATFHYAALSQAQMVKDIYPGGGSGLPDTQKSSSMGTVAGKLLFAANDGIHGMELWISDGTEDGTFLLKDIYAGGEGSSPEKFHTWQNLCFFIATTNTHGRQYWVTDGTESGTKMIGPLAENESLSSAKIVSTKTWVYLQTVQDIYRINQTLVPRPLNVAQPINNIIPFKDGVIFHDDYFQDLIYFLSDHSNTKELKLTIPTDLPPDAGHISLLRFMGASDKYIFLLVRAEENDQIWRTDLTKEGTVLLFSGFNILWGQYAMATDRLIFSAPFSRPGWVSMLATDGNPDGTVLIDELDYPYLDPYDFYSFNGEVFFLVEDIPTGFKGVWRTNGTAEGTIKLHQAPIYDNIYTSSIEYTPLAMTLTRPTGHNPQLVEPYVFDGFSGEPVKMLSLSSPQDGNLPYAYYSIGEKIFFTLYRPDTGRELYAYHHEQQPLQVSISERKPITCHGSQNAHLEVNIRGGIEPFEWSWSNGVQQAWSLTGIGPGKIDIAVSDAFGSAGSSSLTVTEPDALTLTLSSTPENNHQSNGTAEVTVTGGAPPYSFIWMASTQDSTSLLDNISSGWYTVKVSDALGCDAVDSVFVDLISATDHESALLQNIRVSPNPAKSNATVIIQHLPISQDNITVEIVDFVGRIVKSVNSSQGHTFDLPELASGIYFVMISSNKESLLQKQVLARVRLIVSN